MSPDIFPDQPGLRRALFHQKTEHLDNPIFYAIREGCDPHTLDHLIEAGGRDTLAATNLHGLGPLHYAAVFGHAQQLTHLATRYNLDIEAPIPADRDLPAPNRGACLRLQYLFSLDDDGSDSDSDSEADPTRLACELVQAGDTPAHVAARAGRDEAFIALYELGAGCMTRFNAAGESVLDLVDRLHEEGGDLKKNRRSGGMIEYLSKTPEVAWEEEEEEEEEEAGEGGDDLLSEIDEDQFSDYDPTSQFSDYEPTRKKAATVRPKKFKRKPCRHREQIIRYDSQ
ncbi:hypothetical protein VTK56DRAFT_6113 [Thermocarpiscus australiensis]